LGAGDLRKQAILEEWNMDREFPDFRSFSAPSAPASAGATAASLHRPRLSLSEHPRKPVETVPLQAILKGAREAIIDFNGAAYRLRITRNHRLILTK
jgi:hemin uptake protein HemP